MTALLYGVGVGPGDPELLTLKAARLIESADVIFCPRGAGRPGRALTAAARHLDGKRVVQLEMEMRGDRDGALVIAAQTLAAELAQGCGVYLTEGDPSLFSTFQLLVATLVRVAPRVRVEVVPGVSSVLAAAAAAGISLGLADQTLAILPASAPLGLIEDVLSGFDQTVLLKPSMGGDQLPALLRRLGRLEASTLVAEASAAEQEVLRGEAAADGTRPYFSTWLVPGGPPRGAPGRVHFIGAGPGSAAHLTR
ncbi:MAG TPA: precorrin-2 C(20)-methyltransferase, partial [Candidatus Dormibacteraeota bacterium]|nr:precorrin-2 C(20)-methyltransferase [Candidatus Dormibacteraeota bacterium]